MIAFFIDGPYARKRVAVSAVPPAHISVNIAKEMEQEEIIYRLFRTANNVAFYAMKQETTKEK